MSVYMVHLCIHYMNIYNINYFRLVVVIVIVIAVVVIFYIFTYVCMYVSLSFQCLLYIFAKIIINSINLYLKQKLRYVIYY